MGHPRVSPAAFQANLREIIARARAIGVAEVVLGVNHPTTRTEELMPYTKSTYDEADRFYNRLIRQVAEQDAVISVDLEKAFDAAVASGAALANLLLEDGLHLSIAGHDIYYHQYLPVLRQVMDRVAVHR
jgi:lysophospholipase L1-like esterase